MGFIRERKLRTAAHVIKQKFASKVIPCLPLYLIAKPMQKLGFKKLRQIFAADGISFIRKANDTPSRKL